MKTDSWLAGYAQDIGRRTEQQDCYLPPPADAEELIRHFGALFVVCDGMGGLSGGREAAQTAAAAFQEAYYRFARQYRIPYALREAAFAANQAVLEQRKRGPAANGLSGATLLAVLVYGDQLYWASVGDSDLFLFRAGEIRAINHSHAFREIVSLQEGPEAAAAVDPAQADCLVSYIGIDQLTIIDCPEQPFRLHLGDRLILATDGLSKFVPPHAIVSAAAKQAEAAAAAQCFVKTALEQNHLNQDNVTVIVIDATGGAATHKRPGTLASLWRSLDRKNKVALTIAAICLIGMLLLLPVMGYMVAEYRADNISKEMQPGQSLNSDVGDTELKKDVPVEDKTKTPL